MTRIIGNDQERVKTLIDLYGYRQCIWNVHRKEYKYVTKKKAKEKWKDYVDSYGLYCCCNYL